MNSTQFQGIARELIFAVLALIVSFNVFPESNVDLVGALVLAVAVLIWGIYSKPTDGASLGSLVRKALQAIAPVLVLYSVVTPEQGAQMTAVVLSLVGVWSVKSNAP